MGCNVYALEDDMSSLGTKLGDGGKQELTCTGKVVLEEALSFTVAQ